MIDKSLTVVTTGGIVGMYIYIYIVTIGCALTVQSITPKEARQQMLETSKINKNKFTKLYKKEIIERNLPY